MGSYEWECCWSVFSFITPHHYHYKSKRMKALKPFYFFILLLLSACSARDGEFSLKGQLKNFNQGELYIYPLDGNGKIDTIQLNEGKFRYTTEIEDTVILQVVFPNFSEIPVIAIPGISAKMDGDASHLREVSVSGSDENKQLTEFRLKANGQTPPEAEKAAKEFILHHPESPACKYLLNKYFILKVKPDYEMIKLLVEEMEKAHPGDIKLKQLAQQINGLNNRKTGKLLPSFSAKTTKGRYVTNADLNGELNVITVWSSWNFESQSIQRQLQRLKHDYGTRLQLISICIDGNLKEAQQTIDRDSLTWPQICTGEMWDTPLLKQTGLNSVPDNILTDHSGRIIEQGLPSDQLRRKIESILKK